MKKKRVERMKELNRWYVRLKFSHDPWAISDAMTERDYQAIETERRKKKKRNLMMEKAEQYLEAELTESNLGAQPVARGWNAALRRLGNFEKFRSGGTPTPTSERDNRRYPIREMPEIRSTTFDTALLTTDPKTPATKAAGNCTRCTNTVKSTRLFHSINTLSTILRL